MNEMSNRARQAVAQGGAHAAAFTLETRAEEIPESAMRIAALLLLDTIGVAAAAAPMAAGRIARGAAEAMFSAGPGAPSARMMFDGRRASPPGAAYAAASQIDNLDAHDGYNPTKGHIGVVAAPALAALVDADPTLEDLSGPDALAALLVCYETATRAGIALHATASDYHTSGAWNALGVAAMAARLKGFDAEMLRQAFGIAEYHGPRSQMMREIDHPTMLHDGSGWGALVGLTAATLAETGFTGAPAATLEFADASPYWSDLGAAWLTEGSYAKPYPICRWAHAPIDAVRALRRAHGFAHEQIERIEIESFHEAARLVATAPRTTSEAQYSLAFAVAVMAAYGRIGVEHITDDGLRDAAVLALLPKIATVETERHNDWFPARRVAAVRITLRDGSELSSGDVDARWGPEAPFTEADIVEKFHDYAGPVLGPERAEAIVSATLGLKGSGARFADLAAHLYAPVLD